jgi:hypothetical protein
MAAERAREPHGTGGGTRRGAAGLIALTLTLFGCQSAEVAERPAAPQSGAASGSPQPGTYAPGAPAASAPPVPESTQPAPPPRRAFKLGPAAAALVSQAHAQAAHDPQLALDTLERALRIEPANPLLWIELGEVHEAAGHYGLADSMGRKALQLASGDAGAQARAWRLIAESLRARNRNAEASEAQARAQALLAR